MSDDLHNYMEQEIASAARGFKTGIIVLVVLVVVLIAYFQWLKSAVADMIEPGNVAALVTNELRRNIPTASNALKSGLTASAPDVIDAVVNTVLENAVPTMRRAIEDMFQDYARELTHFGVEATAKIFEGIVKDQKELLRERISSAPGLYTSEKIVADLQSYIDRELHKRLNTVPEETTQLKLNQSLVALRNINARLQTMATGKAKSRKDELGRRLITTWWSVLNDLEPDKTAAEKMLETTKMPVTAPKGKEEDKKER
jgi:hypothetical protein